MKKLKVLFDYSPAYKRDKTGIPKFVQRLYQELEGIETIELEKTLRVSSLIGLKKGKLFRFFEQILYHNIYLPIKLTLGRYDVYVENQYMFIPYVKPYKTKVITFVFDIGLVLFDSIQTEAHTKKWRRRLPVSIKNSDVLVTISKTSQQDIRKYLAGIGEQQKPLECVYANVDLGVASLGVVFSEATLSRYGLIGVEYFLFLGTLEPRKNPLQLVKAFHIYKAASMNNVKLVFAGRSGWLYENVVRYVKKNNMESDIVFAGYISNDEKICLLENAIAFLFLSVYEGFGMPPLEALKLGVPTIVSDIPVFHELFEDSVHYVESSDVEAIADKMQCIFRDPVIIDEEIFDKFSWSLSAGKFVEIIENCCGR